MFSELAQVLAGALGGQGVAGRALKNDDLERESLESSKKGTQKFLLSQLIEAQKAKRLADRQALDDLWRMRNYEQRERSIQASHGARNDARTAVDTRRLAEMMKTTGLDELPEVINRVNEIIDIDGKSDLPGFGQTYLFPDPLISRKGKETRQVVASLKNLVASARSGKTVTPEEHKRILEELGEGGLKDDEQLRKGIINTVLLLRGKFKNVLAGFDPSVVDEFKKRGGNTEVPRVKLKFPRDVFKGKQKATVSDENEYMEAFADDWR